MEPKKKQHKPSIIVISIIIIIGTFLGSFMIIQMASATFGFVRVNHCIQSSSGTSTCTISTTVTAGDTEIVIVGIRTGTVTVSTVQSAGSTYTKKVSNVNTVGAEIWATEPGQAASASIIYVNLTGGSKFIAIAADYNGVTSFARTSYFSWNSANPSDFAFISSQQNNSQTILVTGFSGTPDNSFSANQGNLRDWAVTTNNGGSSRNGLALVDNVTSKQGIRIANSVTNADTVWSIVSLEINKGPIALVYWWNGASTITGSNVAGRTNVIVMDEAGTPSCHINSISDNGAGGGSTYYERVDYAVSNHNHVEIWSTNPSDSKAATTITISGVSGCTIGTTIDLEYTGVIEIGNSATNDGNSANPNVVVTTQDTDNIFAGGISTGALGSSTMTQQNGWLISTSSTLGYKVGFISDHSPTATSNTASVIISSNYWAMAMLELRTSSGGAGSLESASCISDGTPLTANISHYYQGITNYIRFTCTADGKAYTTKNSIPATPTFTLPEPFTQLWSFESSTATGTTCSAGSSAWQLTSGLEHIFPSGTKNWDYCAVIPNTATADSTSFSVAWNST